MLILSANFPRYEVQTLSPTPSLISQAGHTTSGVHEIHHTLCLPELPGPSEISSIYLPSGQVRNLQAIRPQTPLLLQPAAMKSY